MGAEYGADDSRGVEVVSDRPCNFCEWQRLKHKYRGRGPRLVTDPLVDERTGRVAFAGGVRVVLKDGTDLGHWFAEVPDRCCC